MPFDHPVDIKLSPVNIKSDEAAFNERSPVNIKLRNPTRIPGKYQTAFEASYKDRRLNL